MTRSFTIAVMLPLLLTAAWAHARPPEGGGEKQTPAEEFKAIQKEIQAKQAEAIKEYNQAKDPKKKVEALARYYGVGRGFADRLLNLAEKNANDPTALDALILIITTADTSPQAEKAAEILTTKYADNAKLHGRLPILARTPVPAVQTLLKGIAEKSADMNKKGLAYHALAENLIARAQAIRQAQTATGTQLANLEGRVGKEFFATLKAADPQAVEKEAEKYLELVVKEYGDAADARGPIGKKAEASLFELRFLAIGKVAPEIKGEDIDGVEFKLSDYRGKVVMLDFWGHW